MTTITLPVVVSSESNPLDKVKANRHNLQQSAGYGDLLLL